MGFFTVKMGFFSTHFGVFDEFFNPKPYIYIKKTGLVTPRAREKNANSPLFPHKNSAFPRFGAFFFIVFFHFF
jgi:hypothetical protein